MTTESEKRESPDLVYAGQIVPAMPAIRTKLTSYLIAEKLTTRVRELESKGILVRVVYDIGARHRDWAKGLKRVLSQEEPVVTDMKGQLDRGASICMIMT